MLFKTFMENPGKVSERPHEKIIVPSSMCIQCHWDGREELPKISRSTGHAMHWFKASIECTSCHAIRLHRFEAEQRLCVNCHKSASVILEGMEEMKCADCHNFRGAGLKPDVQTCVNCHPYRELPPPAGRVLAHQQFECNTCHNTHDKKIRPESTCAKCHFLTLKRGQHPVHTEALGEECMTCHKAHGWRISKESAKTLCAECHEPYPLKFFRTEKS